MAYRETDPKTGQTVTITPKTVIIQAPGKATIVVDKAEKSGSGASTPKNTTSTPKYVPIQVQRQVAKEVVEQQAQIPATKESILPGTPTPGMELTSNELISNSQLQSQNAVSQIEFQQKGIIPSAQYSVEGRAGLIPGFMVNLELEAQQKQIISQEEKYNEQISNYPSGTKFIPILGKTGEYNVILPPVDTMADSRKQLEIAEGLNNAIPGLGEGYKALYGAWGSAVETGRSAYNLGISAIDFIAPGQGQNLRAVAESDITIGSGIFEQKMLGKDYSYKAVPTIWTDEGRTILNKLGSPGYIGAGAFEAASFYVGGKMLEPVIQTGGRFVQGVSKRALTSSLLKGTVTTGEEALAGGGRIAATETAGKLSRFIPESIKGSETLQNFEKWAVQGYKPGEALIEVPVQGGLKQIGESSIQQEFIYQADKSAGRIWLSPTEQAEYAARIGKSGEITINFPREINLPPENRIGGLYSGKLNMTADQEIFRTGFGGIRSRTANTFLKEDVLGTELGTAKGGTGGFTRYGDELIAPGIDVGYIEAKTPLKTMMEEGFTRETPVIYRPGATRLEAFEGFGKQTTPMSEKAIWGLRKPGIFSREAFGNFAKDVRATMTETIQIVKPSSFLSKGERLSGVSMNVPSDILGGAMLRGTSLGLIGMSKVGLTSYNIKKVNSIQQPSKRFENKITQIQNVSMNVPSASLENETINIYGFGEIKNVSQEPKISFNQPLQDRNIFVLPKQDIFNISLPKVNQINLQKQDTLLIRENVFDQVSIQEQIRMQMPKIDFDQVSIQEQIRMQMPKIDTTSFHESTFIPFVSLPKLSGQGGDSGFGFGNYGKKKRYRESKTIDPFSEFRKQMGEVDFGI